MRNLLGSLAFTVVLATTVPAFGQDSRRYEDRAHHDSHEWNAHEDESYRRYLTEHHKKVHDFQKAGKREQNDYWSWRHSHPDDDHNDHRDDRKDRR
jgi:hypothetical protein